MSDYLIFLLCAPMGAFGLYAGHERRGSESIPPRSAVLGLLGAALGIPRTDADRQNALRRIRIAVQPLTESQPMRDFHTVQTVPSKVKRPASRRAAIEAVGRDINTSITFRDYRTDVAIAVAVWGKESEWSLAELATALREPVFPLYMGRKSCPLSAPVNPRIVQGSDPLAAIRAVRIPEWLGQTERGTIACDPFESGSPDRVEIGPVEPVDRTAWHFGQGDIWHFDGRADT